MTAIMFYTAADHVAASIRILLDSPSDAESQAIIKDLQAAYEKLTGKPYRNPTNQ